MLKVIIFIVISFILIKFGQHKITENFTQIQKKGCLISKKITPDGGRYKFQVVNNINTVEKDFNSLFKPFTKSFKKKLCNGDSLGSGRKNGFECIDFLTQKEANKYGLTFSKKTCYDKLDYIPNLPDNQHTSY